MISIKKGSQVLSAVQSVYNSIVYGGFVYVDMVKLSVDCLKNVAHMREYYARRFHGGIDKGDMERIKTLRHVRQELLSILGYSHMTRDYRATIRLFGIT